MMRKKEIKKAAEKFMKANSDDVIDEMSATEEIVEEYLELRLIKSKMYAAIIKNADSSVTDEEANMAAYTIVKLDYKGAYDSNYQYQTYTDEQSAQIKAQARCSGRGACRRIILRGCSQGSRHYSHNRHIRHIR